jgi:hypothetical protein
MITTVARRRHRAAFTKTYRFVLPWGNSIHSFETLVMTQAVCRWRVNTENRVQSQTSPCGDCVGKMGSLIFSQSYSVLTAPSKTWVCCRSLAGIVGSNPSGSIDVSLLYCQVEVSASGWSLVQRSLTECGVSSERGHELVRGGHDSESCRSSTGKENRVFLSVCIILPVLHIHSSISDTSLFNCSNWQRP